MIIVLKPEATEQDIEHLVDRLRSLGLKSQITKGEERTIVGVIGDERVLQGQPLTVFPGVESVTPILAPWKLVSREFQPHDSVIDVAGVQIGGPKITVMAGPCAVEKLEITVGIAREVARAGATILRGGAYKPRSSPYSFQGLGQEGLGFLAEARKQAIIQEAKAKAESIIKQAQEQADKLKDNSHKAVNQAVRDVTLSLKQEIKDLFDAILKREIQHTLSDAFIKDFILKIVEGLPKGKEAGLEISLSQQDKKRLENTILSGLKKEIASGITFKVSPNIDKGLYIGIKNENFHYDFTDQAILGILKEYLRPFIVKIIDQK